jgi:hypothetical protein
MMNKFRLGNISSTLLLMFCSTALLATEKLDVSDPDQALLASNKLFCDNTPETPSLYWWQGMVYSRIPGEKDRHIFNVQGMNIRQCAKFEDPVKGLGFRSVSREIMLYLNPETNEILRQWENPWTGESVEVMHVANDPVNSRAPRFARDENGQARVSFDSMTVMNGMGLQGGGAARLFYNNPLAGDYQDYEGGKYHASEFLTIAYPMDDALDASKTAIQDAVISWGRVSGWLPWMKMRGRTGLMVHWTHGMRLHGWDDLPELLRKEIETNYPIYRNPPPVDDERPNETTWTVFKRWIDEKREKGEIPEQTVH